MGQRSSRQFTFSNLPISSRTPNLLGVTDSIDPSASWPGQSNNRCFPRLNVLQQFCHVNRIFAMREIRTTSSQRV